MRWLAELGIGLFYPRLCLHCQTELSASSPLFCTGCLEHLVLMQTQGRCRTCFAELSKGRCERCIHRKVVVHRQLAACEAMGPAKTLIQEMYQGRRDCIAAAASLMAYQWLEQGIPLPDGVVPMPTSFWQKQKAGLDVSLCLARAVGQIFSAPVFSLLRRKWDHSHFLETGELCCRFQAQKIGALCDRKVVFIAVEGSDRLFRLAGQELQPFFPAYIGALSFATN